MLICGYKIPTRMMVVAKIKTKQTEHITEDYIYKLKTAGQLCIVSRFPLSCSFPRGFRLLDLIGIGSLDFFYLYISSV
jgi:hypothetical protein